MDLSSKLSLRQILSRISGICSDLETIRKQEEARRDLVPHHQRDTAQLERLRFNCDVLEEAESNLEEARENIKSAL